MKTPAFAEAATLGAILAHPEGGPPLTTWLRPSDFADPWHAEVYRTIRHLAATGAMPGGEGVGQELLVRLGPTRADLTRLTGLLRAAPPHPHPSAYALMVLEGSARREVSAQGVLLRAGALSAVLDGSSRPMATVAAMVKATLDSTAARWRHVRAGLDDSAPATHPLPTLAGAGELARPDRALSADRLLAAHRRLDPADAAEREADLVAALIGRPTALAEMGWLRPETLTNRAWRPVYEAVLQLRADGRGIDAVTVCWEMQRRSRAAGPGPEASTILRRVDRVMSAHPGYLGQQVAGDHLRMAADGAARSLATAAANPGLDVEDVVGTGHVVADALCAAALPLGTGRGAARGTPGSASLRALPVPDSDRHGPVAG